MADVAQDDLLIQALIAMCKADAEVSSIVTVVGNFVQSQQRSSLTTYPQLSFSVDTETKVFGAPANRGLVLITGWHNDEPPANATVIRTLGAGIRRLFNVENEVSSINSKVSGLMLRYMSLINSPLLVDNDAEEIFMPLEFDIILGS